MSDVSVKRFRTEYVFLEIVFAIILELREKVSLSGASAASATESVPVQISSGDEDSVVALMTLGFTRAESVKAIARAREQGAKSVEDIIMLALKGM